MQKDMQDVHEVFKHLGIKRITIDIGDTVHSLENGIDNNAIELTEQCTINMPARIRMTALFAVAQCFGAVVLNTCNRSESCVGFDTFFGDSCGCYAPIKNLTKTEVMELAMWLGVPSHLAFKTPVDGLQPLTDEQKFGFTYRELDMFIRGAGNISDSTASKIKSMYHNNKFKLEIINVPGPGFEFLSDVFRAGLYV
jgi:NAD+ synthase